MLQFQKLSKNFFLNIGNKTVRCQIYKRFIGIRIYIPLDKFCILISMSDRIFADFVFFEDFTNFLHFTKKKKSYFFFTSNAPMTMHEKSMICMPRLDSSMMVNFSLFLIDFSTTSWSWCVSNGPAKNRDLLLKK